MGELRLENTLSRSRPLPQSPEVPAAAGRPPGNRQQPAPRRPRSNRPGPWTHRKRNTAGPAAGGGAAWSGWGSVCFLRWRLWHWAFAVPRNTWTLFHTKSYSPPENRPCSYFARHWRMMLTSGIRRLLQPGFQPAHPDHPGSGNLFGRRLSGPARRPGYILSPGLSASLRRPVEPLLRRWRHMRRHGPGP